MKDLVVFLDSVSRTIAGVCVGGCDQTISVENPVIVNAMPNPSGQMSLQLIPVFFREILEDKNQKCVFEYNRDTITVSDITELDKQIELQYAKLFEEVNLEVDTEEETGSNVIDLFGEK